MRAGHLSVGPPFWLLLHIEYRGVPNEIGTGNWHAGFQPVTSFFKLKRCFRVKLQEFGGVFEKIILGCYSDNNILQFSAELLGGIW